MEVENSILSKVAKTLKTAILCSPAYVDLNFQLFMYRYLWECGRETAMK